MRKFGALFLAVITALALSACSAGNEETKVKIPDKPAVEAPTVNAADYSNGYGGFVFGVGGGTVWCTINESPAFAL
jgi:hypothetical protein